MIGQAITMGGRKFNVVILAAGLGTRMNDASLYIPKALSIIGNNRAIDLIISHYVNIAHKFIIATGHHGDLLKSYVKGAYPGYNVEFCEQYVEDLMNNARTTALSMDHVDSRYPTIITFCDLLIADINFIEIDSVLLAGPDTTGRVGTFRHSVSMNTNKHTHFTCHKEPKSIQELSQIKELGVLGTFIFGDTVRLKRVVYENYDTAVDLTTDFVQKYAENYVALKGDLCKKVYEFGNENDLKEVRNIWER